MQGQILGSFLWSEKVLSKSSNATEEKTRWQEKFTTKIWYNFIKSSRKSCKQKICINIYFKYEEPNRMLWHNLFVKFFFYNCFIEVKQGNELFTITRSDLHIIPPYFRKDDILKHLKHVKIGRIFFVATGRKPILWSGNRGEGRGRLTLCLRIDTSWSMDNPMPQLTLTPFNSCKRTKN